MKPIDISIIIVSFNTRDITRDCLHSIYQSKVHASFEVILVDNNSKDDTVKMVKADFPEVKIIENKTNSGFASANNQGARMARGTYLWLLNSDTILELDTLNSLYKEAKINKSYIASVQLLNQDGSVQPQGGALPNLSNTFMWMTNLDGFSFFAKCIPPYQNRTIKFNTPGVLNYGWVGGTAMLIRRDLYIGLGGLDEKIFMYGEDVELCLRAAKGGIPVHYFPSIKLTHLGQQSGNAEKSILGEYTGIKYIFKKHYSKWEYFLLRIWLKVGALIRLFMYTCLGNDNLRTTYAKAFKLA